MCNKKSKIRRLPNKSKNRAANTGPTPRMNCRSVVRQSNSSFFIHYKNTKNPTRNARGKENAPRHQPESRHPALDAGSSFCKCKNLPHRMLLGISSSSPDTFFVMAGSVRHRAYKPMMTTTKLFRILHHNCLALLRTKSAMTKVSVE